MHPSSCTHQFSDHPSDCTPEFSVHPSACTPEFSVHPSACTHEFSVRPSSRTHHFLITHQIALTSCKCARRLVHIIFLITRQVVLTSFLCASISSYACIHRLRLDEVHTTFSDQRLVSISKSSRRMSLLSVFHLLVHTGNLHSRSASSTFTT